MKRPRYVFRVRWWQYGAATLFGMPFMLVGLLLFIPIFTVPLGFLVMFIGAYPLYKLHSISIWWHIQQEHSYKEYDDEGKVMTRPWEDDSLIEAYNNSDVQII